MKGLAGDKEAIVKIFNFFLKAYFLLQRGGSSEIDTDMSHYLFVVRTLGIELYR